MKRIKSKVDRIVARARAFFEKNGFSRAVVGLSGGIDSAVSAALAVKAIGKQNVHALIMPERKLTLKQNVDDAAEVADMLGISYDVVDIKPIVSSFASAIPWSQPELALMNLKSRIRALLLYGYANSHDALVVGTSNKSEILLGYFTKYGDGAVDLEIIGSLFKTEVYKAASLLGIPQKIIDKLPTAELKPGQSDYDELGADYFELDKVLKAIERGKKIREIKADRKLVHHVISLMRRSEHKRHMPPII